VHSSRENGASYRKGPDVGYHKFDALIITALLDELEAVLALGEGGKEAWTTERDPAGFPFHHREFPREVGGEPLRIAAASFDQMGGNVTAGRAAALINYLDPACLAMCGICAGKKKDVALGDVIVADRVYQYDYGKLVARRDGDGIDRKNFIMISRHSTSKIHGGWTPPILHANGVGSTTL
jgi:nucleoside phosphorylase